MMALLVPKAQIRFAPVPRQSAADRPLLSSLVWLTKLRTPPFVFPYQLVAIAEKVRKGLANKIKRFIKPSMRLEAVAVETGY
jgi:hypothetical protein